MKIGINLLVFFLILVSCNNSQEEKIESLWESLNHELTFTFPEDEFAACSNILMILDSLEALGESSYPLNMNRIKCKCTLGNYTEAIELARQENELFLAALLSYIEGNLSGGHKLFQPFIDKYSAKEFLTETEFINLHTSRVIVEGTDFNWETFKKEVYPKCVDIPDVEELFYLSKELHESILTYDGLKKYVCYWK